jgi:hypothetical protein
VNARPHDIAFLMDIIDHADIEHEDEPRATVQEQFDAALVDLMRYRRAEREALNEAARLAGLAHYAEFRIEAALAAGAKPLEVRRD